MVAPLKRAARATLRTWAVALGHSRVGRILFEDAVDTAMNRTRTVEYHGIALVFAVPNAVSEGRVQTFATKEPETLEWIGSIPRGSTLWDIGANVGLYSCFAARARGCRVVAFEPSVFNLELLARNIFINGLVDRVTIIPVPLCAGLAESTLNMTTTAWGGALSTFGEEFGFDGRAMHKVFEFRTLGLSMDELTESLRLPPPEFIKMDVDGIEHLILRGGVRTLQQVKSLSIEINDDFEQQAQECSKVLQSAGLRLMSKAHSAMIEANVLFRRTYNQIWGR